MKCNPCKGWGTSQTMALAAPTWSLLQAFFRRESHKAVTRNKKVKSMEVLYYRKKDNWS